MRLNYPTELLDNPLSLPDSVDQTELNDRGFYIMQGLDSQLAEQLVCASLQKHVVQFCPNDAAKRFKNIGAVEEWQSKGRLALPLVKITGEGAMQLAGFGWMGPGEPGDEAPEIPGAQTTFAIRIYEEAVGQGNASPYTRAILDAHSALFGNDGVWLEAWGDNASALKPYERAGFLKIAETSGVRHGIEVPRVYMTLGNLATN